MLHDLPPIATRTDIEPGGVRFCHSGVLMSFAKAERLLDLATILRARRSGITLNDVENRFGCSRRTAQRMMRQLEARFSDVQAEMEEDGCKRWRMPTGALKDFLSLHADELAALDFAIAHLARQA